jgi:predicted dehydrogenase
MPQAQLIIVDPGHFHATLLQKEMYPQLAPRVSVYAPLGPELLDYLRRIALFNSRADHPTHWELDVHCSADPMCEALRDHPGNVVVFTGRNRGKIDRILRALEAGLNVFADKPWIITASELPKLEQALRLADERRLVAYDIMTERYEVTSELQRVLVGDARIFGEVVPGSAAEPGIYAKSIHHVRKVVSGMPLRRPAWFFDIDEYGQGLADVGTHLVDLVQWTAFPGEAVDVQRDIEMLNARRWPFTLSEAQFEEVTGESGFPPALAGHVRDGKLDYFCNNSVDYRLRGIHVKLEILWNWEASPGAGDVYEAVFRGTKAVAEIRQGAEEKHIPELFLTAARPDLQAEVSAALEQKIAALQSEWPGLGLEASPNGTRIVIPTRYRVGHEAHFAQVARRFFEYLRAPHSMPSWESPNMLAKYYVSTQGVELSQARP